MSEENGVIYRISGPVVTAVGITPRMYEVVRVGDEGLMGEVIELHGDVRWPHMHATMNGVAIKVSEDTVHVHQAP